MKPDLGKRGFHDAVLQAVRHPFEPSKEEKVLAAGERVPKYAELRDNPDLLVNLSHVFFDIQPEYPSGALGRLEQPSEDGD